MAVDVVLRQSVCRWKLSVNSKFFVLSTALDEGRNANEGTFRGPSFQVDRTRYLYDLRSFDWTDGARYRELVNQFRLINCRKFYNLEEAALFVAMQFLHTAESVQAICCVNISCVADYVSEFCNTKRDFYKQPK